MNLPICTGAVKPEITTDGFNLAVISLNWLNCNLIAIKSSFSINDCMPISK